MATMQDIANFVGVSRGTVDRVLNEREGVNEDTRKRVKDAAKLLNYRTNKAGLALATQKRNLKIGAVFFGIENPFFDGVVQGLYDKAEDLSIYGCTLLMKMIPFDVDAQLAAIDECVAEGVHGLLISPYSDTRIKKKINELHEQDIPVITVNTDVPDSYRMAYIGSDSYKAGQTAGGLMGLISHGETEIGIVTGSHYVLGHEDRIHGFTDIIRTKYPNITVVALDACDDDDYKSYTIVQRMLEEHPTITGFYFTAAGVYGGCKAIAQTMGRSPYHVITFDEVPSTVDYLNRGIISATICQEPYRQGSDALQLLMDFLIFGTKPSKQLNYTDLVIKIKESL